MLQIILGPLHILTPINFPVTCEIGAIILHFTHKRPWAKRVK